MAKATATCTCACGAEFIKTKTFNSRREANSWEKWAEQNYTQCPTCWGKAQREIELAQPLTLSINLDPFTIDNPIVLIFKGNTIDHKDMIKGIGYTWGDKPTTGLFGALDTRRPPKCWHRYATAEELDNVIAEAKAIGAVIENHINIVELEALKTTKAKRDAEQAEKLNKIAGITKPEKPACYPQGRWNGKIYGSQKNGYCVYVNNEKIHITDAEAEEIEEYQDALKEYERKINEIEKR